MSDFKTRLLEEKQQLDEKIEKLETFIAGDNFSTVADQQQELLLEQLSIMKTYSSILEKRISLINS